MDALNWYEANEFISLMNEQEFAGHNDWRLPTVKELLSVFDYESEKTVKDQLAAQGYKGVRTNIYWTSITYAYGSNFSWVVGMSVGSVVSDHKTNSRYVWPVRGGQNKPEFLKDLTSLDSVK